MKRFWALIISLMAVIGFLNGCSGGGARQSAGRQCPLNYNPIPMNVPAKQKIDLASTLPPGTFEYDGALLYYRDPSNLRIELGETKQANNKGFKVSTSCVRNAFAGMKGIAMSTQGISKMVVDGSSTKVISDVKNFGFVISDRVIIDIRNSDQKPERPSDVFDGKVSESFLYKINDSKYEIRSHGITESGGEFFLAVRFTRNTINQANKINSRLSQ